jgi:DNA-binding LytR/AlgR family response regulator
MISSKECVTPLDGYDLDIVNYLLKPVSVSRFLKAVTKATKLISQETQFDIKDKETNNNDNAFLYVKVNKEMMKVLLKDILFIESSKEYIKLYLEKNKYLLVKQSISSMQSGRLSFPVSV